MKGLHASLHPRVKFRSVNPIYSSPSVPDALDAKEAILFTYMLLDARYKGKRVTLGISFPISIGEI